MSGDASEAIDSSAGPLDSWTTERGEQVDLFPTAASGLQKGYIARVTVGQQVRWVPLVFNGRGDLESLPATNAPPLRPRSRSRSAKVAALPLLLMLAAGCGSESPTATDEPESPATSEAPSAPATSTTSTPSSEQNHDFPPAAECAEFTPRELPSGADVGERRMGKGQGGAPLLEWGYDTDRVAVSWGQEALDFSDLDRRTFPGNNGEVVDGPDGTSRLVVAVGHPPSGQTMHKFVLNDCPYTLWTADGLTWEEALDYAGRF